MASACGRNPVPIFVPCHRFQSVECVVTSLSCSELLERTENLLDSVVESIVRRLYLGTKGKFSNVSYKR